MRKNAKYPGFKINPDEQTELLIALINEKLEPKSAKRYNAAIIHSAMYGRIFDHNINKKLGEMGLLKNQELEPA